MAKWRKTQTGRVVYPHRVKSFTMRDVRRILADLIIDGQLTQGERQALGSMLYPAMEGDDTGVNFDTITSFLREKFLGDAGMLLPLASWLVGLMEDSLRKSFVEWLKKFEGGKK